MGTDISKTPLYRGSLRPVGLYVAKYFAVAVSLIRLATIIVAEMKGKLLHLFVHGMVGAISDGSSALGAQHDYSPLLAY